MPTTTATALKNNLGAYLDAALSEPVLITESGRDVAVLVSRKLYDHLLALEDEVWALLARRNEQEGYVGPEQAAQALRILLSAQDSAAFVDALVDPPAPNAALGSLAAPQHHAPDPIIVNIP